MARTSRDPQLLPFLENVARGVGRILLERFRKPHDVKKKKGAGIVTEADRMAEDYAVARIQKKYPGSRILAEEGGESGPSGGRYCWIIDPLDGTTNFAHGFPWFCVSLGVFEEGRPVAGAIYNPCSKEMFLAEAGRGASLNGERIRVSQEGKLGDSLLGTGFYYFEGPDLERELATFKRVAHVARAIRRPGSAALDLAFVACGRYDGFWERGLSPWDVAAGFLLVKEAGGRISDFDGKETDVHQRQVVATNGKLHRSLLRHIAAGRRTRT